MFRAGDWQARLFLESAHSRHMKKGLNANDGIEITRLGLYLNKKKDGHKEKGTKVTRTVHTMRELPHAGQKKNYIKELNEIQTCSKKADV